MSYINSPDVIPQQAQRSSEYMRIVDTRLEVSQSNKVCYPLEEGSAVTSFVPLVSSSHSINNTTFNLNNISDFTCRDSRMPLEITVTATLNVTNTGNTAVNVIQADNFGAKQYPLNRCMQNIQHQINQASYSLNTNDLIDSIARLNLVPEDCNFFDNTQPDFISNYGSATGGNLNPLAPYTNTIAGDGIYKPRTVGYTCTTGTGANIVAGSNVAANSSNVVTIVWTFYEPLISPFNNVSLAEKSGLYAITGELITIQWVNDLWNNMFAFVAPVNLTVNSASVSLGQSARLRLQYLTPKDATIASIPRESIVQYNDYTVFTNDIGSCAAGASLNNVSSQVCNFTNMPQKVLVYARLNNNARTTSTPDKYLSLKGLTVQFDNGLPQFAAASDNQLYDISVRNGLQMPRACWTQKQLNYSSASMSKNEYGCGSVMVIDPALDLGIRNTDSMGSGGRFIFQCQNLNFTNNTADDFSQVTLYVVAINSAILERVGSQYRNYLLYIPDNMVNEVKSLPPVSHQEYKDARFSNSFLSGGGIGDWFKKLVSVAPKLIALAPDIIPLVPKVMNALKGGAVDRTSRLFGMPRPAKKGQHLYYN